MKADRYRINEMISALEAAAGGRHFDAPPAPPPRPPLPPLQSGGTPSPVSDEWKASVDRQLEQLHADIRSLLSRGVAAAVALAIMIGGLYLRTDGKFDSLNERLGKVAVQQQRLDDKIDSVDARINGKLDLLLERTDTRKRPR